ncbi:MAG: plasmid mobilization relaxosome protein MobC [Christensenella sp.]
MITKSKKMSIRISEENIDRIHHKAKQANKSFTDYVTDCCLGKQIIVIDGLDEVLKQQKALGRNLNQLTTLANMGRVSVVYLEEAIGEFTAINSSLQEILERRRWSDGNG